MGLITRLAKWALARSDQSSDSTQDEMLWNAWDFSTPSASGVDINQRSALNATAVLACVTILAEDFAKLKPILYRRLPGGTKVRAKDHYLYKLLRRPNDWQSGFEFREMLQISLILRGNAYAAIIRNGRGIPVKFVPVNADWVALWEAPNGELFYRVTPVGLHAMAQLQDEPWLIPFEDMLHIRGFSMNGLLGASRITLAKEAIGLALAQERQSAQWAGNNSRPSGILTTEQKLTKETADRLSEDWKKLHRGPMNAGKVAVLEAGLKFQAMSLSASDMEWIASRKLQVEEVARIFRVPLHMIASLQQSTNNNIAQQSQEYANYTLSGFTERWWGKLDVCFDLDEDDLFIEWDYSALTRADITTRFSAWRTAIMSMFMTPNEVREKEGLDPVEGGDKLQQPMNMAGLGSQSTGTAADGGGCPSSGEVTGGGIDKL